MRGIGRRRERGVVDRDKIEIVERGRDRRQGQRLGQGIQR